MCTCGCGCVAECVFPVFTYTRRACACVQCAIAFGYLQTRGYCNSNGRCRQFPVVVGETGSFMKDKTDVQWLTDFADFVAARVRTACQTIQQKQQNLTGSASKHGARCALLPVFPAAADCHRVGHAPITGLLLRAGCGGHTMRTAETPGALCGTTGASWCG